jgi:hypothetical protein
MDPWDLWHDVVVEVKKRIMQPTFWQALETVIPITIDGTAFVIGLPLAAGYYASHLSGSENRRRLEVILEELSGIRFNLRLIEGTEESDWEEIKEREQAAQSAQQNFRARLDSPAVHRGLTWEALQERIYASFSRSQGHHLPQGRVKYMLQMIPIISEGSQQIIAAAPNDTDRNERALARILEKVAGLVEVPSALVALELMRYENTQKKRAESGS